MFIGTDIVAIEAFRQQLAMPGSSFLEVFTAQELRVANARTDRAQHLAGRWAAKEALVKAWGQSLYGRPPVLADTPELWALIEVVPDTHGRVAYRLHGDVEKLLREATTALSISHDGDYAIAQCLLKVGDS
ncbi:holo-ACP synthase AcpS [Corynebacterium gerontici]|uniref:Holo-[acyl-carrier-protein] synthase n=1 Tax=Corynebacterium gerontici TaxID=2079234 RepID=A0A3G6J1R3_9CORY|nr:holo-ACP synthase [Corynebacterium gerontici]AZA11985.1 Holo-[acyl-carrier-protein] synthase [Corynebacterium gerontici]